MIWLEGLMMTLVIYTTITAAWSDCRSAIIPNSLIVKAMTAFFILDIIYYGIWGWEYVPLFVTNLAGIAVIAFFFYFYHLWAAGDSKLLFIIGIGIPARLYSFLDLGPVPCFAILMLTFSSAFVFIIAESIVQGFRAKLRYHPKVQKANLMKIMFSYLFMVAAMQLCNSVLVVFVEARLYNKGILVTAIDFFLILTFLQVREKISNRWFYIVTVICWSGLLVLYFLGLIRMSVISLDYGPWLVVLIVLILKAFAGRYNYQEIPTTDVKERMIVAAVTVLSFRSSKVQGLPTGMTEDLRSRLTANQVAAIQRWKDSRQGKSSIVIVRKIPFAIFITIGTIIFMIMEGLSACHII